MKVKLEIVEAAYIEDANSVQELATKELVPKMVLRRRLTRAAKIFVFLAHKCQFSQGKIVYGSAYGEVDTTASILQAIAKNEQVSPTAFQNSVYNTPASYYSILQGNTEEILTVSSYDDTSLSVLQTGALLALEGSEVLLMAIETLNTPGIEDVNSCGASLEVGVAMKVRLSAAEEGVLPIKTPKKTVPSSLSLMYGVYEQFAKGQKIIEVIL